MIATSNAIAFSAPTALSVVEHVVLYDVPWHAYEAILEAMVDRRLRHTYDCGVLEIMSPLKRHDRSKKILARMIEAASLALDIDIQSIGSTTLRREEIEKGLEPDECYYVAHEAVVRHEEDYDPNRDPPPDLAIEVDVTHSSINRMDVYRALGIPEVWRLFDGKVTFHRLIRGRYAKTDHSLAFPVLTPSVVTKFLLRRRELSENALIKQFVAWTKKASKQ
jgi:Uma2 family endonuclease